MLDLSAPVWQRGEQDEGDSLFVACMATSDEKAGQVLSSMLRDTKKPTKKTPRPAIGNRKSGPTANLW
jgi:hypothetical protein